MLSTVKPFKIKISDRALGDLRKRLRETRWPDQVGAAWEYGTDTLFLKELVAYWKDGFDWKAQEAILNTFPNFQATVDAREIHFIHRKSKTGAAPTLVLLHGWPGSFFQMIKIIPLLEDYNIIVPSLPGYGFSDKAKYPGLNVYKMAEAIASLIVDHLGYKKVFLRASDMGAGIAKEIALTHPDLVLGLHLSGSNPYVQQIPEDLTEEEKKFIRQSQQYIKTEGAYAALHATKPQTLAYSLNDSPAGLASWIVEKVKSWSDPNSDFEKIFPKDALLTMICIYWFTETINSSMRVYYELAHHPSPNAGKRVNTPTAFFMLGNDIAIAPKEWDNRFYNIVRWRKISSGGHFGEWEEPEAVSHDIKEFINQSI